MKTRRSEVAREVSGAPDNSALPSIAMQPTVFEAVSADLRRLLVATHQHCRPEQHRYFRSRVARFAALPSPVSSLQARETLRYGARTMRQMLDAVDACRHPADETD